MMARERGESKRDYRNRRMREAARNELRAREDAIRTQLATPRNTTNDMVRAVSRARGRVAAAEYESAAKDFGHFSRLVDLGHNAQRAVSKSEDRMWNALQMQNRMRDAERLNSRQSTVKTGFGRLSQVQKNIARRKSMGGSGG